MNHYSIRHKKLLNLLAYVSSNLDKKLSLEELSDHTGISKFHLARVFEAHMGMKLGQYVRIQKLEYGMMQVVLTEKGFLDIALSSGYESHSAFCKEFKKLFGVSPKVYKRKFSQERIRAMNNLKKIVPEFKCVEESKPIEVYYIQKTGNYFKSAPEAWSSLADELAKNQKILGKCERFGISHDNPHAEGVEEESMRFDACININSLASNVDLALPTKIIEGGLYAKFIHKGPLERLGESFHYIYGHWLYEENYCIRSAPPFSRYIGPKPSNPDEQVAEINIPVY